MQIIRVFIPVFSFAVLLFSCEKENGTADYPLTDLPGWEISRSVLDFSPYPKDLYFIDSVIGFMVGYNGDIYKTKNAGESWQKQNSGTSLPLTSIYFTDEHIGFIAGQGLKGCLGDDCDMGSVLLKTTDGGETWSKQFYNDYTNIYSLLFFDDLNGLAIIHVPDFPGSRFRHIARTSDGGDNWELSDLYGDRFYRVGNSVLLAGEDHKIYESTDLGRTWDVLNSTIDTWPDLRDMYFVNETTGFADGILEIYRTINGGFNWDMVDFPFTSFGLFHFINENEGFNIQTNGIYTEGDFPTTTGSTFYYTTDAGISWGVEEFSYVLFPDLACFPRNDLGFGIDGKAFYRIKKK
jgi:photosystem II stability/assembly factor-like uncharacterized protein